ncbi:hypothetical protein MKX01_007882 [Papaver californicum]|nr:hypothetical protein MKX01_007882 [Papaver californicum]
MLMPSGNLVVERQPLIPRVLSVSDGAAIARKPFKPPCSSGYSDQKEQLARRLWARKRFVPWGSSRSVVIGIRNRMDIPSAEKDTLEPSVTLPEGIEPLVLWQSEESIEASVTSISIAGFDGEPMTKRAIIVTPTSLNDLEEFFAMVNFTNPGILGDAAYFRRYYESPIISGREPTATEEERNLSVERSAELSTKVNQFILRRTNALLSNHLPPKIVEVVCCKLSPLQSELYNHFIHSKNVKHAISEETKQSKILAYITALKKLCNHPKVGISGESGSWTGGDGVWVELSGILNVLARLLTQLRRKTDDRIVLVSNYTQTLDLFAQLCRERRYPHLRLDGTTSINPHKILWAIVKICFIYTLQDEFVFLLSSKAGGCGLNLIDGNRLVFFDPDWNPANDKQAAARVWRDGQKKRVYIYRFLSTGTIEEKVYQRQMSKEGLQKVIQKEKGDNLKSQGNALSTEDLRDLINFYENSRSEIHENMNCSRCKTCELEDNAPEIAREAEDGATSQDDQGDICGFQEISGCLDKLKSSEKQLGTPLEEDLGSWGHHFFSARVPDSILQASAGDEVTFVFTNQVDGKLVPVESMRSTPRGKSTSFLRQHAQPSPVILSNGNSNSSCKTTPGLSRPSLKRPMKFTKMTTQSTTPIPTKPRTSFGKQLPLKEIII